MADMVIDIYALQGRAANGHVPDVNLPRPWPRLWACLLACGLIPERGFGEFV